MTKLLQHSSVFALSALAAAFMTSCGSKPAPKALPTIIPVSKPNPAFSSTAGLAKRVLKHPKIILLKNQVSGRVDSASAYHNVSSAAKGFSARRSNYGKAPGGYTKLDHNMLKTMLYLADVKGYTYRVTSIAGGSHSSNSRHYKGIAFDVDRINGRKVGYGNPHYRNFMRIARAKGATEVLGPGDRAHSTHLHLAWPR